MNAMVPDILTKANPYHLAEKLKELLLLMRLTFDVYVTHGSHDIYNANEILP